MTTLKHSPHQLQGRDFLLAQPTGFIIMPTGSGKTEVALMAIRALNLRTWVICPKSLRGQWLKAAEGLPITVITFPQLQHQMHEVVSLRIKSPPEMIVIDEPKPLKGQTIIARNILAHQITAPRRVLLDATPLENNLGELWYLLNWLLPDELEEFMKDHQLAEMTPPDCFVARFTYPGGGYRDLDQLQSFLRPYVFRPSVPAVRERKINFIDVPFRMSHKARQRYDLMCSQLSYALKNASSSAMALNRSRGLISRLRSFMSDPKLGAAAKVEMLLRFAARYPKRRGVIFVFKRETAQYLAERLNEHEAGSAIVYNGSLSTKVRERLRQGFNEGSFRFLVATSAGERGVDLPTGNLVVHFDLPWTRAAYDQRDRVSRLSSEASAAWIITFLMRGSVDEVMWSIIIAKQRLTTAPFGGAGDVPIRRLSWGQYLSMYLKERKNG